MTTRINGAGLLLGLNQTHNFTSASKLRMALGKAGHTAGSQSVATVSAYTTFNEPTDSGYGRQTLTGVTASAVSGGMKLAASDPSFANSGSASGESITGGLVTINLGGAFSTDVPLLYSDFAAAKNLTGTTQPVLFSPYGMLDITTAATTHKIYPAGLVAIINNTVTLATAGNVYCRLIMTSTTALGEEPSTIAGFTTLDECNDSTYARQTVTGLTWANPSSSLITASCSTLSFANTGNASRVVRYALFCLKVGGSIDGDDIPLALQRLDSDATLGGTTLSLTEPGNGFLKLAI